MLTVTQVKENIKRGVKMRMDEIPYDVGVPCNLLITDYIDDEIIADQAEEYNSWHNR